MNRRSFLATSAAAGLALGTSALPTRAGDATGKQLLEMRTYHFKSPAKQQAFEEFLARAAIPALNRAGVRPVGVFKILPDDNPRLDADATSPRLHILLPHDSPESCILLTERLASDPTFVEAGREILECPKSDPAYERYESSLMLAFDGVPKVEVPTMASSRLLQLRIYESHSPDRALMKIHMFNEGGEIAIFRRCGMNPVFFGQSLVGSRLPNLTYMLSFEDKEAQDKGWGRFRDDPAWLALRQDETYKDAVSNITNFILRPAKGSQV